MKITIIGAGNIGGAIARGLAKGHMFKASDITCTAQSDTTLEKMRNTNPDFVLSLDNVEAVSYTHLPQRKETCDCFQTCLPRTYVCCRTRDRQSENHRSGK